MSYDYKDRRLIREMANDGGATGAEHLAALARKVLEIEARLDAADDHEERQRDLRRWD